MNEGISMALQVTSSFIALLVDSAVFATLTRPGVLHAPEPNISIGVVEGLTDGILPVGRLGAI
jgi:hypothetical protein